MGYQTQREEAARFAGFIKGLGFRVFLAKAGTYGFITDEKGSRVLSFGFTGIADNLSGNYWPPSSRSGTGWRMDQSTHDLKTKEDVERALHAYPPPWAGDGWKTFTTVEQYLKHYGPSSQYEEI